MKLIIDIPDKVVKAIQNGEDYRYDIHTAIAQGKPYEERPQGEWINHRTIMHDGEYYCSNCDEVAEWLDGGSQFLSNYCPNCGAKMRTGAD